MILNRHGIALLASVAIIGTLIIPSKAKADSISYSISAPSLLESTFKPGGNLDFAFSLVTNNSKIEPVYCSIDGFLNPFEATLISGPNNNGRYRCLAAIPARPMELRSSGTYPLDVLIVYFDEFGKQDLRQTFGYINFAISTPTPAPVYVRQSRNLTFAQSLYASDTLSDPDGQLRKTVDQIMAKYGSLIK